LLAFTFACEEAADSTDIIQVFDCTEIGCSDSFDAQFSPVLDVQGEYLFTLELDGQVTTCTLTLPLGESQFCDAPLQISQSGSALPESEHHLPSFTIFETGFTTYTLTIELDGIELVSWTEEPEWEVIQPNGEGCDPVCEIASSTVVIP
jgi:hypothetical protein